MALPTVLLCIAVIQALSHFKDTFPSFSNFWRRTDKGKLGFFNKIECHPGPGGSSGFKSCNLSCTISGVIVNEFKYSPKNGILWFTRLSYIFSTNSVRNLKSSI